MSAAPSVSLGYSPCPNDTFIFYALVHARMPGAPLFNEVLEDIETLNSMALRGELDVVKVSFHALAHLSDAYCLLSAGGALGRGCGPLIVSREELSGGELHGRRVAIPGKLTTAALLLRLYNPDVEELVVLPFDEILQAVGDGTVDAGVIIHESRFTYAEYGLRQVLDLGEWWEQSTGHPIPLGGIAARRDLGGDTIGAIDRYLRQSIEYAHAHPEEVRGYVAQHAQEMDRKVMEAHIELYVNEFTLNYGRAGRGAIDDLLQRASAAGIAAPVTKPLFMPSGENS